MLEAYFDDGGSENEPVAVIAGYVAPADEWARFEVRWNAFLEREHLPFYHSVDSAHAVEHFSGRTLAACNLLHREAVEIITSCRLIGIGAGVRMEGLWQAYADLAEQFEAAYPNIRLVQNDKMAYLQDYHFVLQYLGSHLKAQIAGEQVSVILEQKPKVMGMAVDVHEYLLATVERDLAPYFAGPPTFRPKLGYPQLQAADVFAYEMALDLKRHFEPNRKHATRGAWQALWEHAHKMTNGNEMIYCQPWDAPPGGSFRLRLP